MGGSLFRRSIARGGASIQGRTRGTVRALMKRILVVDDDPHLRDVVVYTLQRDGHAVTAVGDGACALEALLAGAPPFDLVVLDILMPELDGLEVCRRLRASARSATPVVFLSSRDEEIDKVLGLELGGDDYVTKPFSPRELAARVKAVLRRAERPGRSQARPQALERCRSRSALRSALQ